MKKILFILTIYFYLTAQSFAQKTEDCSGVKVAPEIQFSTSYGNLQYDFGKTTQTITQIAARIGNKERSAFATGLATVTVDNEYVLGTKAVSLFPQKGYCVIPEKINVYVGFSDPVIYISRELKKKSCQYNLVMLHEKTHQRINKTALDYFVPYFQFAASKIGYELQPIYIESLDEINTVTNKMTLEFTRCFDKVLAIFKKELAVEQGKLDNQANYMIEDDICRNFNAKHFRR